MLLHMQLMTSKTILNSLLNIVLVTELLFEPLIAAKNQCFGKPKATTIATFNG